MLKSAKKPLVPQVQPRTISNLWAYFDANLPYTTFCVISAVITVIVTLVYLFNRFKRERNANLPAGDGDKNVGDEVQEEKNVTDREEGENPDTSEGQDGSEEDLPWILQKAPSETTLSDDKGNWTNDEKHSEETSSEKSQDFARLRKTAAGDLDGATKGVKVITAVDEYTCEEHDRKHE